jgi:hypothetical protein
MTTRFTLSCLALSLLVLAGCSGGGTRPEWMRTRDAVRYPVPATDPATEQALP